MKLKIGIFFISSKYSSVNILEEYFKYSFQYLATLHYEGFDAVTALFKLAPGLRKVRIQFNANEAYTEITKGDLRELQKTIKKNIGRAEYREKIKVISDVMNINISTVKSKLSRGKEKLKNAIMQNGRFYNE